MSLFEDFWRKLTCWTWLCSCDVIIRFKLEAENFIFHAVIKCMQSSKSFFELLKLWPKNTCPYSAKHFLDNHCFNIHLAYTCSCWTNMNLFASLSILRGLILAQSYQNKIFVRQESCIPWKYNFPVIFFQNPNSIWALSQRSKLPIRITIAIKLFFKPIKSF